MAKANLKTVSEYIASQPAAAQGALRRLRSTLRKALPGAEEVISYNIPAYKLHGRAVIYFAGWKQHYSIYPITGRLVAACQCDPAPHVIDGSTVRFALSQPVPVKMIEQLAKLRAREIAGPAKAQAAPLKKKAE